MSAEQQPAVEPTDAQQRLPLVRVLLMVASLLAVFCFGIWYMGNLRERANEARSETLTEKYGVTIKNVDPMLRNGDPVTWSVDGVERECALAFKTDTLRCEDETGALVEVGK